MTFSKKDIDLVKIAERQGNDADLILLERLYEVQSELQRLLSMIQGPKGDKGDKGEQGFTGERGEKGDKGERGERGAQGIDGRDGKDGIGIQGEKGDKGDQGDAAILDATILDEIKNKIQELDARPTRPFVGGSRAFSLFTDDTKRHLSAHSLNLKAGAGVTLSYSDAQGRNDVTIEATGATIASETPVGTIDASNVTFTVSNEPLWILADGVIRISGQGYTYAAGTVTYDALVPPVQWHKSFYAA